MVYNQMNSDRSNLLDERRNDGSVRPPFYWHHIRPERQRWGIIEIWRNKSDMTRQMFDRGITNGEYGPNWVTHWLLYSVFRSRDVRNNRNRRKGDDDHSSGGMLGLHRFVLPHRLIGKAGDQRGSQSSAARTTSSYYDPARNGYH